MKRDFSWNIYNFICAFFTKGEAGLAYRLTLTMKAGLYSFHVRDERSGHQKISRKILVLKPSIIPATPIFIVIYEMYLSSDARLFIYTLFHGINISFLHPRVTFLPYFQLDFSLKPDYLFQTNKNYSCQYIIFSFIVLL